MKPQAYAAEREGNELQLLQIKQAARLASVHIASIRRLLDRGEIESVRFGLRSRRILESSFRQYLERQRRQHEKPPVA
jgi:excisionase family DNA binding protein